MVVGVARLDSLFGALQTLISIFDECSGNKLSLWGLGGCVHDRLSVPLLTLFMGHALLVRLPPMAEV